MTEIRETYAAWKARILEEFPDASILIQHRDGTAHHAQARVNGHMVAEPWNINDDGATPDVAA